MDYSSTKRNLILIWFDIRKRPLIAFCVLSLLLIAYLIHLAAPAYIAKTFSDSATIASTNTGPNFEQSIIDMSTGTIKKETKDYSINAEYPIFNILHLDNKILGILNENIDSLNYIDPDGKRGFSSHYDSVFIDETFISFRFWFCHTQFIENVESRCVRSVSGINYDRKNDKFLTIDDALTLAGININQLSDKFIRTVSQQYGTDIDKEGLVPKRENFSAFIIKKDEIIFILQPYQLGFRTDSDIEVHLSRTSQK